MCLWTKMEKPIKAETPIKAYKVLLLLGDAYFSPVQYYEYTSYLNGFLLVKDVVPEIEYKEELYILGVGRINRGLHLFANLEDAKLVASRCPNRLVFECEIPEGSYYFLNKDNNEICTNQFRFIREV